LIKIGKDNWERAIESFTDKFDKMHTIVKKTNEFSKEDYVLKQSQEEIDIEIKENNSVDIILNHVKKINDEYSKLDRFNLQLKDLLRCKLGTLD
jgi:hypothetical protein